jgi:hypothetical protein
MSDEAVGGVHWSFWIVSGVALIWNIMGCANFVAQMNPKVLAGYSETSRALIEGRPGWVTGAFAISQFGGALGCLLLLLRKSVAIYALIASLLGVVATEIHTLRLASSAIELTTGEIAGYVAMPVAVAAFLAWYAKQTDRKGWIR